MIISKTPYRVSFVGGLSDVEEYFLYSQEGGCVISAAIDKYIYIMLNPWHDNKFKITYSKNEEVDTIDDIKHPIYRECLKYMDIKKPLEIISAGDIRGNSGLGSSSSFTVGLLHVLHRYKGDKINKFNLAEEACKIELDILDTPGGKQDQYAAAFGGLNFIEFDRCSTRVTPIYMKMDTYLNLQNNILLFNTGTRRDSKPILSSQINNIKSTSDLIDQIANTTRVVYNHLLRNVDIDYFGQSISKNWELKKSTGGVSNSNIDNWIQRGITAGAIGGKLCGAGQGGYLMFYCKEENQQNLRNELKELNELRFKFDEDGSRIIYA